MLARWCHHQGRRCARGRRQDVYKRQSKSRGNAIAPQDVIDMLGVEGYRYYFMTDVTPGTDGAIKMCIRDSAVQRLGDRRRRHRERVPHDEAEVGVVHGVRRENRLEFGVHLDGHHAGSFLHKCERQRANAWPHLEHALGARKLSQRHNALDDMIVDKEVLTLSLIHI